MRYLMPTPEIEGWMSPVELEWIYQEARLARNVVELGFWKGRSAHAFSSGCSGLVISVDDFLRGNGPADARRLHPAFLNHRLVVDDTAHAATLFHPGSVDLVFIDAGHNYDEVLRDIRAWDRIAARVICGHDYIRYPGVTQAVQEIYGEPHEVVDSIWAVRKTSNGNG